MAVNLKTKGKGKIIWKSHDKQLTDIICGTAYQEQIEDGNFLSPDNTISGIFNTDGVQIYSSSGIKLWPIYIAINEIPIKQRFARENMLLVGIWQGKGQPPYFDYMNEFGNEMTRLYEDGVPVNLQHCGIHNVKLGLFLGTLDLSAKCKVLNMTQYNGSYGCSTCSEEGIRVKQGKGTIQCYPYRPPTQRPDIRDSDDIKFNKSELASPENRIEGIVGLSGLASMPWFDLVLGIVPDYMHGVMLGATKTLMYLWFSATNHKKPFFIGNKLKRLSKRMKSMCPPDYIERLPRDLEQHFNHLKAAEYEAFLLYYGIPCLQGYLPDPYLEHFATLSESIYILLGDSISNAELDRAELMLNQFYAQFADLYGNSYSGLNIHNIGCHLVDFVRRWGPLYCWSAFGFEDINGQLVKTTHGTGDVKLQLLRTKEVHGAINVLDHKMLPDGPCKDYIKSIRTMKSREWKGLINAENCCIIGPFKKISTDLDNDLLDTIIRTTQA